MQTPCYSVLFTALYAIFLVIPYYSLLYTQYPAPPHMPAGREADWHYEPRTRERYDDSTPFKLRNATGVPFKPRPPHSTRPVCAPHPPPAGLIHAGNLYSGLYTLHDKTASPCILYRRLRVRLAGHFCAVRAAADV